MKFFADLQGLISNDKVAILRKVVKDEAQFIWAS